MDVFRYFTYLYNFNEDNTISYIYKECMVLACIKTSYWKVFNYYRNKYMILYFFPIAQNTANTIHIGTAIYTRNQK